MPDKTNRNTETNDPPRLSFRPLPPPPACRGVSKPRNPFKAVRTNQSAVYEKNWPLHPTKASGRAGLIPHGLLNANSSPQTSEIDRRGLTRPLTTSPFHERGGFKTTGEVRMSPRYSTRLSHARAKPGYNYPPPSLPPPALPSPPPPSRRSRSSLFLLPITAENARTESYALPSLYYK